MRRNTGWARASRPLVLVLVATLLAPSQVTADDVPADAQRHYDKALGYVEEGGEKNLKRAWKFLRGLKEPAATSCDFWLLYLDVGRRLGEDEADLWEDVERAEAAHPDCLGLQILRAKTATTIADRKAYIRAALEKRPDDLDLELMLADVLIDDSEEFDAEEIIDKILEAHPGEVRALVRKGRIQLAGGYPNAAVEFVDETIGAHPLPALHHLKAQALLTIHEDDGKDTLDEALTCVEAALAKEVDPAYIVTLARVLEKKGDTKVAKSKIEKYFADNPTPLVASLMGGYAFAEGDYKAAIEAFGVGAGTNANAAIGLAVSHARLGHEKKALAALKQVERLAPEVHGVRAMVLGVIGRPEEARDLLAEAPLDHIDLWLAGYDGVLGRPGAIRPVLAKRAAEAGPEAEYLCLCLLEATLYEKMGVNKANGIRTKLRKAGYAAAASGVPSIERDDDPIELEAETTWYMERVPHYHRSECGTAFTPRGAAELTMLAEVSGDDVTITPGFLVRSTTNCERDPSRSFKFQMKQAEDGEMHFGDSEGLETAFREALESLAAGDLVACEAAFATASELEPHWHRAKLFGACAKALNSADQAPAAAKTALAACKDWPDDTDGRVIALILALWAGVDADAELAAWAEHRDAIAPRDVSTLRY